MFVLIKNVHLVGKQMVHADIQKKCKEWTTLKEIFKI